MSFNSFLFTMKIEISEPAIRCNYLLLHEVEIGHIVILKIMLILFFMAAAIKSFFIHTKLLWYVQL
jgi:hypothetical protein